MYFVEAKDLQRRYQQVTRELADVTKALHEKVLQILGALGLGCLIIAVTLRDVQIISCDSSRGRRIRSSDCVADGHGSAAQRFVLDIESF